MRRDFVVNVSHEIRTPLTVFTGFVETLQSLALPDEERARYLAMMAQQAHRMQTLVNDLLMFSCFEGSLFLGLVEWMSLVLFIVQCDEEVCVLTNILNKAQQIKITTAPPLKITNAPNKLQ